MPTIATGARARRDELTFRGNLRQTRYGWLRLTPAYSVHLVSEILDRRPGNGGRVLDPFCGTGTTALVCAERGISAETTDINPFLLWLTAAKTRPYAPAEIEGFRECARRVEAAMRRRRAKDEFVPNLHQIEKWWAPEVLRALGRARGALLRLEESEPRPVVDLLKIAFCQSLIANANVSFGHQSMSFKKRGAALEGTATPDALRESWALAVDTIARGARSEIRRSPKTTECDARELGARLGKHRYDSVITSPPYPNRMSYIRELRPYMYWLGYLGEARDAAELDWQAIGGTWGSATSRVGKWRPPEDSNIRFRGFSGILRRIASKSPLLSRYVEKYFHDMDLHCRSLFPLVEPRGSLHYIVGNSKFYDVLLPVERIFAALFAAAGFAPAGITKIRKRTSKRELYEYVVSATKP